MATNPEELSYLKRKAYEWAQNVVQLYNTPVPPSMQSEKNALLNRAKTIKQTIEKVTGPLDVLAPLNPVIAELGIIPLIIGAVGVAAAAAAITYWLTSYGKFKAKLALELKLRNDGVTDPTQRARLIEQTLGEKSLVERIFNPAAFFPLAIVGGGILYLLKRR